MQYNLIKKHVGAKNKTKLIPAKFKFTGWSARDVHASLIFFDWSLALGTWL